jgi:hypothetical protein
MLRRNAILLLILVVALGVRISYIPPVSVPSDTSTNHGEFARNIVDHGRWFVVNDKAVALVIGLSDREHRLVEPAEVDYRAVDAHPELQAYSVLPVGPSVILAGLWKLTGDERYIDVQIVQIIVDTLVVLLVYRSALLLFKRRRTALIAAAAYAIFPPIAQQTSYFSPDIWAVDFTVAIVAAYLQALHSKHWGRMLVLCGVIIGIASFFRPNVLIFPVGLALAGVPWDGWRRSLRNGVITGLAAALVLVPWTIHNYEEFHGFVPTRSGFGVVLYGGLGEVRNKYGFTENELTIKAEVHKARPDILYSSPEYGTYLRERALRFIEGHPFYYARLVARRIAISTFAEYLSPWMHGGSKSPFRYHHDTGRGLLSYAVNRPVDLFQSAFQPAIFMFAMLALALTWRGRLREHALLLAVVLLTIVPYWLLHIETRYVLPASLAYLLWISLGLDLLAERIAVRRSSSGRRRVRPAEVTARV